MREVFQRVLEGESLTGLAIDLNRRGVTGALGGKWNSVRIRKMLSHEKYLSNTLLQKQYRNNHLEKKEISNRGELPQYYAEGTYEAMIDQASFDAAQELLAGITENSPVKQPRRRSAFTSMIACAVCGRNYKRCTGGKRHFWNCPTAVQTDLPSCGTSQIPEKLLYALAAQVLGLAPFDERTSSWKGSRASMPSRTRSWCSISMMAPRQSGIGNTYPGPKAGRRRGRKLPSSGHWRKGGMRNGKSRNGHPAHHSAHHAPGA